MLCGTLNCPGPSPGSPHDFTQLPSLSTFATRELTYPSLINVFPAASQATSVTCRNIPSAGGSGGFTCFSGPVPSSEASCFRPNTITTCPSGLNLITMSDPLSVTQMLSCGSTFTACAYDHAYKLCPISLTNFPLASNSSNCAPLAPYAGPVLLPREKTKTCPFELAATPATSPK